jgi:predicted ATPase
MIVCLVKADNKIYLLADEESKCIQGFKSVQDGLDYFEKGWREALDRGGSWPASAMINFMTYEPSIIKIKSYKELKEKIVNEKKMHGVQLSHDSGFMVVLETRKSARKYWEKGAKPQLMEVKKPKYRKPKMTSRKEHAWW